MADLAVIIHVHTFQITSGDDVNYPPWPMLEITWRPGKFSMRNLRPELQERARLHSIGSDQ